jgi:hypothetical protein
MSDPRLNRLARIVEAVLAYWSALRQHHDPMAAADDSTAASEAALRPEPDQTAYAYHVAEVMLGAVHDHLNSMRHLLDWESPVSFGVLVLSRAALEASSRAWWLLDPSITPEGRVQRVMTESLHNQRDLQLAEGNVDEEERRRFRFPAFPDRQASIDELLALAAGYGWPISTYGAAGFKAVGDKRPSATGLARMAVGSAIGGVVYNATSAATHGGLSGIYDAMAYDPDPTDPDGHFASFTPNVATIELGVCIALVAVAHALDRQLAALGRNEGWTACRHYVFEEIREILGVDLSGGRTIGGPD